MARNKAPAKKLTGRRAKRRTINHLKQQASANRTLLDCLQEIREEQKSLGLLFANIDIGLFISEVFRDMAREGSLEGFRVQEEALRALRDSAELIMWNSFKRLHEWETNPQSWEAHKKGVETYIKDLKTSLTKWETYIKDAEAYIKDWEAYMYPQKPQKSKNEK